MSDAKTRPTQASVEKFLAGIANEKRREDCRTMVDMMRDITGEAPTMWGDSLVGFGSYHYTYATGREGDWPLTAVSPRKQSLTLYIMPGFDRYEELMSKLGKYKTGASCLYVNKLEDVHLPTLRKIIDQSVKLMRKRYPER
ncbi:MAG TPA: DUF1801 domain-containing protein [Longimicrobiales bacterium]|nr:DUF1801 domain-containing protein [Longimicrobiales bacterium]